MNQNLIYLAGVLLDASLKSLLILLIVAALMPLARKTSASLRHFIWMIVLSAVVLLPIVGLLLPQWQIALLPAKTGIVSAVAQPASYPQAKAYFTELASGQKIPSIQQQKEIIKSSPIEVWIMRGLAVWLTGAVLVILRWLLGVVVIGRWISRRADESIKTVFEHLRARLNIRRRVKLLAVDDLKMPITCGIFRPAIMLPRDAENWPAEQLRCVLLHELAHVKRWDCATQFLGQMACAMYWMNPLAWLAARQLRLERERACDDIVLQSGQGAVAYAEHLVHIARTLRWPRIIQPAAVAMARPSQLRGRLVAILDENLNRHSPRRKTKVIFIVMMLALLPPLAMLRAAQPATTESTPPTTQPETKLNSRTPRVDSLIQQQHQLETAKADFEKDHPDILLGQVLQQQLTAVAQQYTAAQLATIEARSIYSTTHPAYIKAKQKETDLYIAYHEVLDKMLKQNSDASEYAKIVSELEQVRARILNLEEHEDQAQ